MLYLYLWNKFSTAVTAMFSFCTIHSELPCICMGTNLTHQAVDKITETYVNIWLYVGVCMTRL
jgi:hypothetical protein